MDQRSGFVTTELLRKVPAKQSRFSPKRQAELRRTHASGDYSITDRTELVSVSRPTVCRTLYHGGGS